MAFRPGVYIVPTHRWYIERTVWLIAGGVLLVSTAMADLVHPLWILLVIVTALASYCIMANGLYWLGAEPRLTPLCRTGGSVHA